MKKFYPANGQFHPIMHADISSQITIKQPVAASRQALSCKLIGQGTWKMGSDPHAKDRQVEALRYGIERGLILIDTAELYANGEAHKVVGQAIQGRRKRVFLVDKILPSNASLSKMRRACEASLTRLNTDFIDLYLLHWRGPYPLAETVAAFENLKQAGLIGNWGVSNFDVADLEELSTIIPLTQIGANQVLYNLLRRGIEYDLIPWAQAHALPLMAYSPLEQGRILHYPQLEQVANRHNVSTATVALAFVLRQDNIVPIVKTVDCAHIDANLMACNLQLSDEDMAVLERVFPPVNQKVPLEML